MTAKPRLVPLARIWRRGDLGDFFILAQDKRQKSLSAEERHGLSPGPCAPASPGTQTLWPVACGCSPQEWNGLPVYLCPPLRGVSVEERGRARPYLMHTLPPPSSCFWPSQSPISLFSKARHQATRPHPRHHRQTHATDFSRAPHPPSGQRLLPVCAQPPPRPAQVVIPVSLSFAHPFVI